MRRHHAAASAALLPCVVGHDAEVTVLAAFPRAAYLTLAPGSVPPHGQAGNGVVAVVAADGVHLPNSLVLAPGDASLPGRWYRGQRGALGAGRLAVGDDHLDVVRWWRPRPVLRPVAPDALRDRLDVVRARLATTAPPPVELTARTGRLATALAAGDESAAVEAARRLLGWGPGLTPAGDDAVAGVLAGTQLVVVSGHAGAGRRRLTAAAGRSSGRLAALAAEATTAVSAALLGHAARGEVAVPAAELLRMLTAAGDPATSRLLAAADRLVAVGSTSGRDLTVGLLAAGEAVLATVADEVVGLTGLARRTA